LVVSVSATTRPPRPGEQDGVDYRFLSDSEFRRRRDAGEFLECFEVYGRGYWYGTLRAAVSASIDAGQWVVLEIDVQGKQSVVQQLPGAVTFFVRPASLEVLEQRLRQRGTENEETIQRRLEVARQEWRFADQYDYQIVNDSIPQAVAEICQKLDKLDQLGEASV
jgi:guanylate kinase